jgi:hypothetical protein
VSDEAESLLDELDARPLAVRTYEKDPVCDERICANLIVGDLFRERRRLLGELDRRVLLVGDHRSTRLLGNHERPRTRRRSAVYERHGAFEPPSRVPRPRVPAVPARHHGGLGRTLRIPGTLERVDGTGELVSFATHEAECLAGREQKLRRRLRLVRKELERVREKADGSTESAQRERSLTRLLQRAHGLRADVAHVFPGGATELDRSEVVMGQRLGTILCAILGERLDPLGGSEVKSGPSGARKLPVGGVTHERVHERMLRRSRDRRAVLAADELLALERAQRL